MKERRRGERHVVPEIYRKYITFKIKGVSGDFVEAELFDFSPKGIRIRSRYELPLNSTIECLIAAPKSLTKEIPFKGRVKYCIQEEPMGNYLIGGEVIEAGDKMAFDLFLKIHDFIEERIGDIY